MDSEEPKIQSVIKVTYERDGIFKEYSKGLNYQIARVDFPCDLAEILVKLALDNGNPPKNIALWIDDKCVWTAPDFTTANIN